MITMLFYFSVFLLFGVGIFLIAGTLKGIKILIEPPVKWYSFYPYWILNKIGKKAIFYFHIFVGLIFIFGAVLILIYVLSY